jgi:hypothetical protein
VKFSLAAVSTRIVAQSKVALVTPADRDLRKKNTAAAAAAATAAA